MKSDDRAKKIRDANAAFNSGDIRKARELYLETDYKDGLIRMGDYFMYDKKLPLLAFGYYKKAGYQKKIDEIFSRMLMALAEWIGKDKFKISTQPKKSDLNPESFQIHPILKAKALEILNSQNIKI